ncbi:Uncharacterized protein ESCO_004368 [Escovopsis weberi]|uniref:LDB19 N-terminal domain-containing protein n=1 Tax=Escovopsis weberi TaxID=150374 RepID=A0A0M9VVJ3_ESCWE|nr:Uncharacterized protein ESCO_004368 [Escovopsis weberi]
MPHLVSNIRSSIGHMAGIKNTAVSRSRNSSRAASRSTSRNPSPHATHSPLSSASSPSTSSAHEDHTLIADLTEALKKHHRLSLHFGRAYKEHGQHQFPLQQDAPSCRRAAIDCTMESSPIVFHGTPDESTGALVTGQLILEAKEDLLRVESFAARLDLVVTQKKPFSSSCSDCQTQTTTIQRWEFLSHLTSLGNGKHHFPFSVHLGGHFPASMNTPLVSIAYVIKAEAIISASTTDLKAAAHGTDATTCLAFERTLDVKRSLPEPIYPHNSVRVFPPTNIKATANYMSTLDPNRSNNLTLKLDGLMTHNEKFGTVDLWRLKKLTWKLEETIKTMAPPCKNHEHELDTIAELEAECKGHARSETRVIGEKSLFEGWKSSYTGSDGTVDFEFDFFVNKDAKDAKAVHHKGPQPKAPSADLYACDNQTDQGTSVTHSLCLELVISKEYAQEGKTHQSHQTGTGRILRMHFAVVLTNNAGMGVSWDNEAPPVYEDVPPSPPSYQWEEDPIEYADLEELDAARAFTAPNSRRHSRS